MKRYAAALLVLAATAPPASAGGGGCVMFGEPSREVVGTTVLAAHACFEPAALVVAPGTTVTFRNDTAGTEHDVGGPGIGLAALSGVSLTTVRFDRPGLYPFHCRLHVGMAGVVVVRDAAAPAQPAAQTGGTGQDRDGGGSAVPWAAAGVVVLVGGIAFARRVRGVPLPAR